MAHSCLKCLWSYVCVKNIKQDHREQEMLLPVDAVEINVRKLGCISGYVLPCSFFLSSISAFSFSSSSCQSSFPTINLQLPLFCSPFPCLFHVFLFLLAFPSSLVTNAAQSPLSFFRLHVLAISSLFARPTRPFFRLLFAPPSLFCLFPFCPCPPAHSSVYFLLLLPFVFSLHIIMLSRE